MIKLQFNRAIEINMQLFPLEVFNSLVIPALPCFLVSMYETTLLSMTAGCLWFIALFCPCSLRSFPMQYVAFARGVKRPTRRANPKLSFTAPSVITAVSEPF